MTPFFLHFFYYDPIFFTERLINDWIAEDADLKTLSRADLEKDFKQAEQKLSETGIKFIDNFLKISGFI
ncbi:MAG: hypothetical protein HY202_04820 [Nitrospirae bacterium]|nr:hypothetical protein [Nitrospirota bacterium]